MELTEDEIIKKCAISCGHCNRKTLLPNEYEFTCVSCGYNVIKRKNELSKIQGNKINFINRLKCAEQKVICLCVEVYKIFDGDDYDKKYEVLSSLKTKKIKLNKISIEKYIDMLRNPKFEQNNYLTTSTGI